MATLDSAIHIGKESTYGTPVTPSRSFEGMADSFKRDQERLESTGMRAGMQGVRSDRVVQVNMGGTGSLEVDVLNKGMGMLLEGLAGTTAGPTQVASTSAYTQTHANSAAGPTESYTVQVVRPMVDGANKAFTHHGCKPTAWSVKQDVSGLLKLSVDYDFEDVETATAEASAVYPASTLPFAWTNAVVTIDSTEFCYATSFSMDADLAMKTDRRYLCSSAPLKGVPVRSGLASFTGSFDADFASTTQYDAWVAGTVFDMNIKWSMAADLIESGHTYEFELDFPAVQWTGESPEASNSDVSKHSMPFTVLDNGSDPMVTVSVKSTDSAL